MGDLNPLEILTNLEIIREDISECVTGIKNGMSWIKPKRLSARERNKSGVDALNRVNHLIDMMERGGINEIRKTYQ